MSPTPAFDPLRGPDRAIVDDCVHCGFCLPACPTYRLWGQEMDSPRGRIHLMRAGLEGRPLDTTMVKHMDACLGCQACVPACPSGVRYEELIEATRVQIEERHRRSLHERLVRRAVFSLFPHPRRLRALIRPLRWYQRSGLAALVRRTRLVERLSPSLAAMERLAPPVDRVRTAQIPERTPAAASHRATVGVLSGCVQSVFFPYVNAATVRVLAAEGCDVVVPRDQSCCGALSLHLGREEEATRMARATVGTFESAGCDAIAANAAGCGSAMKSYDRLLRDDPEWADRARRFAARVRDVSELLVEMGPVAPRAPLDGVVAYHDACHLAHAQGVRRQPRALLRQVPGLDVRDIPDGDVCCGSAGVYNILQPVPARELGTRRARATATVGADLVVTANPGCMMQLRTSLEELGEPGMVAHVVEVLDASIRGRPLGDLARGDV